MLAEHLYEILPSAFVAKKESKNTSATTFFIYIKKADKNFIKVTTHDDIVNSITLCMSDMEKQDNLIIEIFVDIARNFACHVLVDGMEKALTVNQIFDSYQ
jgi:hypothetical protein